MIERLLKKQVGDSNTYIGECRASIAVLYGKIAEELLVIQEAKEALQGICLHINVHKVDGTYTSGGYDHVSEEIYTIECINCGKVLESKCIRGTYA
jgi:hypothetical protein